MIPLKGINGAAIATLITQIIVSIISPLLFKETRICSKYIIEGILIESYKIIISAFKKERLQNDIK